MYDIRQFKPMLYTLIILGISGFALAWEVPGIWVLAVGAILLNAWLVKTGRFHPMPRFVANTVTLLGLLFLVSILRHGADKLEIIGDFLVMLQIIKLYEQRANRDYAQLLVLSLLLMVSASISTASVFFGMMLIAYLFLSLYSCLLFHLKVETDHAKRAIGLPETETNPASLRQDERNLSKSMRRLTVLMALFAVTTAVVTFLFFPRGSSAGLIGPQWQASRTLTGFSTEVNFQTVARITQNQQRVAWVKVTQNGKPYNAVPLLLRGLTLDHYSGNGNSDNDSAYKWKRTLLDPEIEQFSNTQWRPFGDRADNDLVQEITLYPTGTKVLFAIGGISAFKPNESAGFRYSSQDEVLQSVLPITQPLRYQVASRNQLGTNFNRRFRRLGTTNIDPQIEQFARRPEVSGSDAQGALVNRRGKDQLLSPLDATIAHNIERYLQTNFTYTLDLTDAARIEGRDPMVAFLYDFKRGHCEYFAGAMTLMCQSLGMQARMVVGFKCDDYNSIGNYYTVLQSHAHAWVEVLDATGVWQTFDPTSSATETTAPPETLMGRFSKMMDFMQYTWANSVIAYDTDTRDNLIQTVDRNFINAILQSTDNTNRISRWLESQRYLISSGVLSGLIVLMLFGVLIAVLWFLFEQWKLRRRARRIGLDALPANQQLRLAKQLGFYDELLQLLERHRIIRPPHLTPLEFSDSLTFLPIDAFDSVQRLTDAFYLVRYGHRELTTPQQRQLVDVLTSVESSLAQTSQH